MVKRLIQSLGWTIYRTNGPNTPGAQILAALNHVNSNLIFDIGANTGQFAEKLRSYGFAGKIVSFEPLSSVYGVLSKASQSDSDWLVHPRTAVGDHDGEIQINIAGNSVSSSVLPMLDAHSSAAVDSAYVASEHTPLVKLDSVSAQYLDSNSRPFIKIDTQGFEWQVLDGATNTLEHAKGILLELSLVPLYDGQRLWRDVIERMEAEGFTLWAIQKGFTDPRTGRSLQVDAIFLRE
jgi:FkbM family methyltransferase